MTDKRGFSLLELLIAGAVFLIILGIIASGLASSSTGLNTLVSSTELNQDVRVAGQLISEAAASALYLYPPGAELRLNSAGSFTVRNPRTGDNVWQVGTDPILAFLSAPEQTGSCSSSRPSGCVYFVAYYPVLRSVYVRGSSFGEHLQDARNDEAWVLMEYRKRLELTDLPSGAGVPQQFSRGQGRLLADFIAPGGFNLPASSKRCRVHNRTEVNAANCNLIADDYRGLASDSLVTAGFRLEAAYLKRRGVARSPRLTFRVSARNLQTQRP